MLGHLNWGPCGDLCVLLGVPHKSRHKELGCSVRDCPPAQLPIPGSVCPPHGQIVLTAVP